MSRLARFAWAVLVGNVAVILWGAFVRATGSGAGCGGHWPTCNGDVVPRAPTTATLIELSHRVSSGVAFGAVMLLGFLVWRGTSDGAPARRPVAVAMGLMAGEVLIGAAIVLLGHVALDPSLLHGVFAELHAGNTFLLLGALTLTAQQLGGAPALRIRERGALVVPLAQAFAGVALTVGSGAIAALGDTLFPARSLAEGFTQDVSSGAHVFLHIRTLHPLFAMLAFVLVVGSCTSIRARDDVTAETRTLAAWVVGLVCLQSALGLVNLWLLVPIATQLVHLLCADVLFIALVLLTGRALASERTGSPGRSAAADELQTPAVPRSL